MADKREEILEAAKGLFNRFGYNKTSVDDISQAVGMRKSSLYYYFKNKEDIFMSSFKDEWGRKIQSFIEEANQQKLPADRIEAYVKATLNYYKKVVMEHRIPVKALLETRNTYRSFINSINRGGVTYYENCINDGIKGGSFKECEVEKVSHSIYLVKFSVQYDQLSKYIHTPPTDSDWANILEEIVYTINLILDGIKK